MEQGRELEWLWTWWRWRYISTSEHERGRYIKREWEWVDEFWPAKVTFRTSKQLPITKFAKSYRFFLLYVLEIFRGIVVLFYHVYRCISYNISRELYKNSHKPALISYATLKIRKRRFFRLLYTYITTSEQQWIPADERQIYESLARRLGKGEL